MSTARSMFTDAIEEHLALKKQNATLDASMPLARYDVGDPLDRFPGGSARAAGDSETVVVPDAGAPSPDAFMMADDDESAQLFVGPSPEQAMEAATLLEPTAFGDQPMEPFGGGMTPLLSLVEDIEDDVDMAAAAPAPEEAAPSLDVEPGDVLRFPGGVGPRDEVAIAPHTAVQPTAATPPVDSFAEFDAPTGEQPVLVIDTSEPLAPADTDRVMEPSRSERRRTRPRFFGLGKKKQQENAGDGWFTDGPRDFNWD